MRNNRAGPPQIRYSANANGPDGGGGGASYGGGGGSGGTGGVRTVGAAPPQQQQEKAQAPITLHHPANHMMSAYHTARPPAQPPPTGGGMPPGSYIHYQPTALRPQPRQHQHQIPAARATLIPYYESMNAALCAAPFYSSPLPVPIVYSSSTATSDTSRAQPQGPYTWQTANPAQQPVTIMTQPQTVQQSPQPQPQQQPSPYPQNQYTFMQPRAHPGYTTTSGAVSGASSAGVQQAPPAVIIDSRQLQPSQPPLQGKNKNVRKNRIPIINPDTMQEVNVDESGGAAGAAAGAAASGVNVNQDHSNSGHHTHVQHSSSNQVSGSTGNARLAADFAKQVALAALDNEPPSSRPPREEEPQVNGPAGVALVSSPVVEETVPVNKRPPGPTPVVSAQAEGTTYDLHRSSSSNRSVEIRSGESSPARSKTAAPILSAPPPPSSTQVEVVVAQQQVAPPPQQHNTMAPPVVQVEQMEPPKQQRRPRVPAVVEEKKPSVQTPVQKPSPQVIPAEEKEEESRSRTSSMTTRTHPQQPSLKEEEAPKQSIPPVISNKPIVVQSAPIKHPASSATLVEAKPTPLVIEKSAPIPSVAIVTEKPKPVVEKKQVDRITPEKPLEKVIPPLVSGSTGNARLTTEFVKQSSLSTMDNKPPSSRPPREEEPQALTEPLIVEKPPTVEQRPEPPKVTKMTEKRPVSPAVTTPTPTVTPAAGIKTPFAENLALGALLKISRKAAQTDPQPPAPQQISDQQSNATEASHGPVKTMQKSKQKTKQKMREMNQKGVEKEGTELDAFFVNMRTPAAQTQTPVADNNNRTGSGGELVNRNNDISNRTAISQDSNKDIRNVDNVLRPVDNTTMPDSNSKTDRDKSPAATTEDATNNNINNQIAQQYDEEDEADTEMVAAKNEENMKKNLVDSNSTDSSQVISPPSSAQSSLKYQYKDDQWSPLNPQGKKVYDRDFLMKLREDPLSVKKPDITTDLEIYIKDRDNIGGGGGVGSVGMGGVGGGMRRGMGHYSGSGFGSSGGGMRSGNNGFMPDFGGRSISQRMATKRSSQNSSSNRGPGGRSIKPLNSSLSLRDEYKLNQTENAWKPAKLNRTMDSKSKEEKESEDLYKKVRGILNKLTPQKFETLVQQFQSLPFTNLERLQGTIKLVFEKAVDEPAFSVSYAQLCKVLGRLQVLEIAQLAAAAAAGGGNAPNQEQKGQITFRKLLITRCQQEFETNKKLELDFEKRQKDINETPDPEKRKELQVLFNEEERKIRMKSVGLVTFIGELFKLKMLTVNIMFGCIKQLLGKIDEESLECLCKLLTTIGKEFEEQITNTSKGNDGIREFNDYFAQMGKLSRKHDGSKVSSRVRFMLQDVIELRQSNWVPRRDENKPKKMEEIQKEVERESEKAAILAAQSMRSMSQNMNQDRQRRNNPRGGNIQSEDGWTNVGSKYPRSVTTEVNKMQGLRSIAGQELEGRGMRPDMTFGPPMSLSRWTAGSGSSNRSTPSANFTDMNTFSLLENADKKMQGGPPSSRMGSLKSQISDDKERDKQEMLQNLPDLLFRSASNRESTERDNSRGRGGPPTASPSPSLSGPGPTVRKPNQEPQKRPIDSSKSDSSRESTPSAPPTAQSVDKLPVEPVAVPSEPAVEVNVEKLKQCASTIIEEYICNKNVQESIESYKEIFTDDGSIFVSTCLNYLIEQMKREKRLRTSQLLGELMKHQMFPISVFITEMGVLFDLVYDLEVDIPHIWHYFGEIFGDIMTLEVLDFSNLKQASTAIPSESLKKRLDATLKELMKLLLIEKGPVWIKKLWDSSNVQLKDFVDDKQARDALLAEFPFIEGREVALHDTNIPYDKIQEKLLHFLKGSTDNFDHIYAWLTTNVGLRTNEPSFIRELTEAVIKASLDLAGNSPKIDKELLHKNMMLIKRYVDNKEELELWCLYAVQYVVCVSLESPLGMLHDIFQEMYESLVISPDGFNKWRNDSTHCQNWRLEGRGVAVAVTKSFFTQMEEDVSNDEHDDDDMPS